MNLLGHVNLNPSGTDFVSFGGWMQPPILIKQIGGNIHVTSLCGTPIWHAFIINAKEKVDTRVNVPF